MLRAACSCSAAAYLNERDKGFEAITKEARASNGEGEHAPAPDGTRQSGLGERGKSSARGRYTVVDLQHARTCCGVVGGDAWYTVAK